MMHPKSYILGVKENSAELGTRRFIPLMDSASSEGPQIA
jgi:hypothetical protein